jgi:hypothetical protein
VQPVNIRYERSVFELPAQERRKASGARYALSSRIAA